MKLLIHGTDRLHAPQLSAEWVPRAGEELLIGMERYFIVRVRWSVNEAEDGIEFVHVDVAPDPENRTLREAERDE